MRLFAIIPLFLLLLAPTSFVNAEVFDGDIIGTLDVYTNQLVYAPGDPIFVHGKAIQKEPIIIRLFTPDGTIAEFEQLIRNYLQDVSSIWEISCWFIPLH